MSRVYMFRRITGASHWPVCTTFRRSCDVSLTMSSVVFDMTRLAVYLRTVPSALQRNRLGDLLTVSITGRSTSDCSL